MQRGHIDLVDVRAFLAIDLDIHVEPVHDGRHGVVLEAFMRHDMAPVAGGVADGKQDRPSQFLGFGKGCRRPAAPMDRIVAVLPQIGTGFFGKQVSRGQGHVWRLGVSWVCCDKDWGMMTGA